jgi:hypothetical protein
VLVLKLEPLLKKKAKENQSKGGGGGKAGCQKSDKVVSPVDTKKELAAIAHVSHDTIAKVKTIEARATRKTALPTLAADSCKCYRPPRDGQLSRNP